MGAHPQNIFYAFTKRLYAKGKLSMDESRDALVAAGEHAHFPNGTSDDPGDIEIVLYEVIVWLAHKWKDCPGHLIEPVEPTEDQQRIYKEWLTGQPFPSWESASWAAFSSMRWKYAPGIRNNFKIIPVLGFFGH